MELFEAIARRRGAVLNLHRTLANQPAALQAFMVMSSYIRDESSLEADLREIVTLAVAFELGNEYELHHHLPLALARGVAQRKIDALTIDSSSNALSGREEAAVVWARRLTTDHFVTSLEFAQLAKHLAPAEMVDVALTVGWYLLCAAVIGAFDVRPESEPAGG